MRFPGFTGKEPSLRESVKEIRRQSKVYRLKRSLGMYLSYEEVVLSEDYKRQILEPFASAVKAVAAEAVVLDVGAGAGEAARHLTECGIPLVIPVDLNQEALVGQRNAVRASAWELPFKSGSITGIHMKDAITHIPRKFRQRLFSEMERVLVPGGLALVVGAEEWGSMIFQYQTSEHELLEQAVSQGLVKKSVADWQPRSSIGDWYYDARKRFALFLGKQKSGREINSDIVTA